MDMRLKLLGKWSLHKFRRVFGMNKLNRKNLPCSWRQNQLSKSSKRPNSSVQIISKAAKTSTTLLVFHASSQTRVSKAKESRKISMKSPANTWINTNPMERLRKKSCCLRSPMTGLRKSYIRRNSLKRWTRMRRFWRKDWMTPRIWLEIISTRSRKASKNRLRKRRQLMLQIIMLATAFPPLISSTNTPIIRKSTSKNQSLRSHKWK